MGNLSDLQRGNTVGAGLAGASVITTATLLRVSRAAVFKVMMAYTNHGRTSSAKRNSGWKPKLSKRDCHTLKRNVSKNHKTTASKVTAQLNTHLEDHASTKTVWQEIHRSNIYGTVATATPLITENKDKRWWDDPKNRTYDDWKWSDESSFMTFLTSGGIEVWRICKEANKFWMPGSNCETLRWICEDFDINILVFCWS